MIDDDPIFNLIYTRLIVKLNIKAEITTHLDGEDGLNYLESKFGPNHQFILFLDINMPIMDGWDFLKQIEIIEKYKDNVKIYLISSSTDAEDFEKASKYKSVEKMLSKPLLMETIKEIFKDYI
jgi:response regulator RpfG family c-di-GMP phosphodiesterase